MIYLIFLSWKDPINIDQFFKDLKDSLNYLKNCKFLSSIYLDFWGYSNGN